MSRQGIPAAVLVERIGFLLQTALLELQDGNEATAKAIDDARLLLSDLRKAI